jgi:hypothetical protein
MATYKNVGGMTQVMDPTEVARKQQLAKMLMQGGQDTDGIRHWTQALGSVLQTGVGSYLAGDAARGQAQGQQSGNKALAQMLMGGDGKEALANPYSADKAMEYQVSQSNAARRLAEQKNDPMRQLQIQKLQRELAQPVGAGDTPSHVREYEYFSKLTPEKQQQYLQMKRSIPFLNQGTQFAQPNLVDPSAGPVQTLPIDVAGKRALTEIGAGQGKATVAYPMVKQSGDRLVEAIDRTLKSPALPAITGFFGGRIPQSLQTEAMATAQADLDQIQGATFLQAYNDLRGGGPIAVAESTNARAAYNTLINQKQGTKAYKEALVRFRDEVVKLQEIANQRQYQPEPNMGVQMPAIDVPQNSLKSKYGLE